MKKDEQLEIVKSCLAFVHDNIEAFTNHFLQHHAGNEDVEKAIRDFADSILEFIHNVEPDYNNPNGNWAKDEPIATTGKYILDGHKPVPCDDLLKWADWFETADRTVLSTELPGGVRVSTVFLGIDHSFGGEPLLFETMIFGGPNNQYQDRCSTWREAEKMHAKALKLAREDSSD